MLAFRLKAGPAGGRQTRPMGLTALIRPAPITTMGRNSRPRLAGLLLCVTLLGAACDHPEQASQTPGQASLAPATSVAPPTTATLDKPCLRGVRSARPFWFGTSAGAMLVGVVLGRGRTGLVLAHGRGGDLCEWLPRAQGFAEQGYQALVFDFAGFGDSRPGAGPDARIDTDVVAAAGQLRRRGADEIVLIGSSMGATAVLVAATRIRPPVAGVVSLSGPAAFGAVSAWTAMPRLRVPVLLVSARNDQPFLGAAQSMYRRARAADKRLLIAGRGHGSIILAYPDDGPKVLAGIRRFIADQSQP
jgi:pimeloyl-ACP methyl ester carboxylesterase